MAKDREKFIIFRLADTMIATRVADINEMIEYNHPKEIHTNLPNYFEGIFNLRGEIVTSINLKTLLGLNSNNKSAIQVIFGSDNNYVAAGIDQAETIEDICCQSLVKTSDSSIGIPNDYYLGNYTYGNTMVGVFELKEFLLDTVK